MEKRKPSSSSQQALVHHLSSIAVFQEKGPLALLKHPSEAVCAMRIKLWDLPLFEDSQDENVLFCSSILDSVSRSFAVVIRLLPSYLRPEICLFYIILRALDTIEDDMVSFEGRSNGQKKAMMLRSFHSRLLEPQPPQPPFGSGNYIKGIGTGSEAVLLEQFDRVLYVWHRYVSPSNQRIIADVTERMGMGMVEFCDRDMSSGTKSCAEYNLYCYYVAGLVGQGLTSLFVQNGGMSLRANLKDDFPTQELATAMGVFLQKSNIIRDFSEDFLEGRTFWPREIWGSQKVQSLGDLLTSKDRMAALNCLNEMVLDAMQLLPSCLKYLELLRDDEEVFRFCAIPQVMAMATLTLCFNNPNVFKGVVKIRKGLSASILCLRSHEECLWWFRYFVRELMNKAGGRGRGRGRRLESLSNCSAALLIDGRNSRNDQGVDNIRPLVQKILHHCSTKLGIHYQYSLFQ